MERNKQSQKEKKSDASDKALYTKTMKLVNSRANKNKNGQSKQQPVECYVEKSDIGALIVM